MEESSRCCPECKSVSFAADNTLRERPSIVAFALFGWIALLWSHAFRKRYFKCSACGYRFQLRSSGSLLCMLVLVVLLAGILVAMFSK
ncbi:hypothetical protein [Haloferula sp. BvORR071]|uniref:hypothetical protein n=1 Tax=Haloferula sp. BvORR071 TaxID=1396141 RepID=UPI00054D3737|nr:hypothetical protein [Haloferula sp. BvORR071]